MSNFFSGKKKLFTILAILVIVIVVPLTVIISQKQQEIRQRASGGEISLYFVSGGNCNGPHLTNQSPGTNTTLCIDTSNYLVGISGFNIVLSADTNLIFQSATSGIDADKLDTAPAPQISNPQALRFTRINISNNITNTPLNILNFNAAGAGTLTISTAEITSLGQDAYLTVSKPSLIINTQTLTPTSAPTRCEGTINGTTYTCKAIGCSITETPYSGPLAPSCQSGQYCCGTSSPTSTPTPSPTPAQTIPPAGLCAGTNGLQQYQCYSGGCPQSSGSICAPPNTPGYPVCSDRTQYCLITQLPTPTTTPSLCQGTVGIGILQCAIGVNSDGTVQCPSGYTTYGTSGQFTNCTNNPPFCCIQQATLSPTPVPGSIQLALSLTVLSGITNYATTGVINRPVTVVVMDSSYNQIGAKNGNVAFASDRFSGTIDMGTSFSSTTPYTLEIKMGSFLKSFIPNFTFSTLNPAVSTNLIVGLDDKNNRSIEYYGNGLVACYGSTIGNSKCNDPTSADLNGDGSVDKFDYNIFLISLRAVSSR